jgi:hypothetical protein
MIAYCEVGTATIEGLPEKKLKTKKHQKELQDARDELAYEQKRLAGILSTRAESMWVNAGWLELANLLMERQSAPQSDCTGVVIQPLD